MGAIRRAMSEVASAVDGVLDALMPVPPGPEGRVVDAMRYATLANGKRLRPFLVVCGAVSHAHRNLVVHRDLKPRNILVTQDGEPKLLDFGIATVLNPELSGDSIGTRLAFTAEYASPEQILGEPITTASDVYSLGVLLYELLCAHLPLRRDRYRHPAGVVQAISALEPPKPSTAMWREEPAAGQDETNLITAESVSSTRDGDPARLSRALVGDVDAIALKALRREPEQRYGSAEQFSEDIRHHLEGLPVEARAAAGEPATVRDEGRGAADLAAVLRDHADARLDR